jgi:flavin-dependent dehydrogenase
MGDTYDVLVVGGGPGGSTAALVLAREGFRVCVLEKDEHPRFHIGESILPRNEALLRELGLSDRVRELPHLPKYGAEFGIGDCHETMKFTFRDGLVPGLPIFNIERAHLDRLLADVAGEAGAEFRTGTLVRGIEQLDDSGVAVRTDAGVLRAKLLLDASGHGTVVGRHLKLRKNMEDPNLQKVAYFQHFTGVEQLPGDEAGNPCIIMCQEGWFWLIGLTPEKTSVGFVTRPEFVRTVDVPPDRILQWAIARCPVVRHRMRAAVSVDSASPDRNHVLADFSYTCGPNAGPGYFLVGDAGCFLDPIFSTGVTLAMVGAQQAAQRAAAILRNHQTAPQARAQYIRFVRGSTGIFWSLIKAYYNHSFRELFMNGTGPHRVHSAVISILAGQVFPRPIWALRWRLKLFFACVWLQRYVPLVPRRKPFSLVSAPPEPIASLSPELAGA